MQEAEVKYTDMTWQVKEVDRGLWPQSTGSQHPGGTEEPKDRSDLRLCSGVCAWPHRRHPVKPKEAQQWLRHLSALFIWDFTSITLYGF